MGKEGQAATQAAEEKPKIVSTMDFEEPISTCLTARI